MLAFPSQRSVGCFHISCVMYTVFHFKLMYIELI